MNAAPLCYGLDTFAASGVLGGDLPYPSHQRLRASVLTMQHPSILRGPLPINYVSKADVAWRSGA
jgi:hypothetical protein